MTYDRIVISCSCHFFEELRSMLVFACHKRLSRTYPFGIFSLMNPRVIVVTVYPIASHQDGNIESMAAVCHISLVHGN
jgi:hypothetical protein